MRIETQEGTILVLPGRDSWRISFQRTAHYAKCNFSYRNNFLLIYLQKWLAIQSLRKWLEKSNSAPLLGARRESHSWFSRLGVRGSLLLTLFNRRLHALFTLTYLAGHLSIYEPGP